MDASPELGSIFGRSRLIWGLQVGAFDRFSQITGCGHVEMGFGVAWGKMLGQRSKIQWNQSVWNWWHRKVALWFIEETIKDMKDV